MDNTEYKMLQFSKQRNKLIYEVHMISDLVTGLQKAYDKIFALYILKCNAGIFDEDFAMLCEQMDILYKDIHYYTWFQSALPHNDFGVVRHWATPAQ